MYYLKTGILCVTSQYTCGLTYNPGVMKVHRVMGSDHNSRSRTRNEKKKHTKKPSSYQNELKCIFTKKKTTTKNHQHAGLYEHSTSSYFGLFLIYKSISKDI